MRTTADNYVQIRIKATDTAKPELDSLRADLDELGSKVDTAKVEVDDADAKLKLLEINAELARLNKQVANPKIDAAGAARAESRIEKLKGDLDDLEKKAASSPKGGLLGKILMGLPGGGGGGEGGSGGGGSWESVLGNLSGLSAGGGGIAAAIGALLVEIDGLASGFAAAGAGAGAFALLAIPAFDKVKTAYTNVSAAQAAYQKAQLTEKMDPTAANATAVSKALLALRESYKGLDGPERGAVHGIQSLMDSYHKMAKAFEPDAFRVFNQGLKIANQLLPLAKPFADTFATSLDGLLKQVSKFTGSSGFKDWLKQFHSLEGPAVTAIGRGLGQVAVSLGKLFTAMSAKDVVNAINIAFSVLAGTISALDFIIRRIMLRWDQWQALFRSSRHTVADWGHNIATWFDRVRHDVAAAMDAVASRVSQDVSRVTSSFRRWYGDLAQVVSWFRALPGRILGALSSLPGRLFSLGAHIIAMLADGIRSAIGDVTGAIGSVASEILDHIPHSPAKKGPLSGRGDPRLGGMRIGQLLAEGMRESTGAVSAAADRVAGATVPHGGAAGYGGGRMVVQLEWVNGGGGDAAFFTWIRRGIRARGGLQKALGP